MEQNDNGNKRNIIYNIITVPLIPSNVLSTLFLCSGHLSKMLKKNSHKVTHIAFIFTVYVCFPFDSKSATGDSLRTMNSAEHHLLFYPEEKSYLHHGINF